MPRDREERPDKKEPEEKPGQKQPHEPRAEVADVDRESSQPEASNHKGTAGDVYGR